MIFAQALLVGLAVLAYVAVFMTAVVTANDAYNIWRQPYVNDKHRWRWPLLFFAGSSVAVSMFAVPLGWLAMFFGAQS